MTNFMLLFLDKFFGKIHRLGSQLVLISILFTLNNLHNLQQCECTSNQLEQSNYLHQTTRDPNNFQWILSSSSPSPSPSSQESGKAERPINKLTSMPNNNNNNNDYNKPMKQKLNKKLAHDKLLHLAATSRRNSIGDSSRRQFVSSDDFNHLGSSSSYGNSILSSVDHLGNYDKSQDLDPVEMHTNNHQSSASAINNIDQQQQVNFNEHNLQQSQNNANSRYNNYINHPLYSNGEFYGNLIGKQNKPNNYQAIPNHSQSSYQSQGPLMHSNNKQSHYLSKFQNQNNNNGLNQMQSAKPGSSSQQQQAPYNSNGENLATSLVGSASSSSSANQHHHSLSLYSVPSLSAMQQLLLQQAITQQPATSQQPSSSQGHLKLISSQSSQYLPSNSIDVWDGSGNFFQHNNNNNGPTTTTTTTTSSSLIHPENDDEIIMETKQPNESNDAIGSICGRQQVVNNHREPRIVGGNSTFEGEFPWAVSIQRHGNHHCGGVILARRWILTAAHCVRSQLVANLLVRTGGHTLSKSSGNSLMGFLERDYFVDSIVMHTDFSKYDNLTGNQIFKSSANTNNADIALLKLRNDIQWNEHAWPVCFPQKEAGNFSGHDAIVIGWGKLNEKSDDFSNELQKVKLNIIDNKLCQNWFRQAGREMAINERIICAGFKAGGKDACHGDSGGPLLSKVNGQYVVVGVVSTGIGCARPLLPGLYSRVSSYVDWIEKHVQIDH